MAGKPQTIAITNFSGRLTRILNGELNSGFAKFNTSWGYDPFSEPLNLTWFEQPTDISTGVTDTIVCLKPRNESGTNFVFGLGSSGKLYKFQTTSSATALLDSIIAIFSVKAGNPTFNQGGSIEFFGNVEKIYIGWDDGINTLIPSDGSGDTQLGSQYKAGTFRPLKTFIGKLLFGNGNTFGAISNTNTITSSVIGTGQGNLYSEINPPLPVNNYVKDLDVSRQGDYLIVTATEQPPENILSAVNDYLNASSADSTVNKWNGIDESITSFQSLPSNVATALHTYLGSNMIFSSDSFGTTVSDGNQKLLSLPNNKSPLPNSTSVNGDFLTWMSPETSEDGTQVYGSLYYFGSLDQENPKGLYRVLRYTTSLSSGFVYQVPAQALVNNKYMGVNSGKTGTLTKGLGKHYFSTFDVNSSTTSSKLYRFLITPSGSGTPVAGVYETQTQIFSKKIDVKQIRVYTKPTVTGNGFQIDMIDSAGDVITNGTFNYSFTAGSDVTKMQGSLDRINFNPKASPSFSLGLCITNTGSTNMTIKKIEIDWEEQGK